MQTEAPESEHLLHGKVKHIFHVIVFGRQVRSSCGIVL